eukprot:SAG31_NODE_5914_length_2258_cov_2.765632_3_plen_198_part_01
MYPDVEACQQHCVAPPPPAIPPWVHFEGNTTYIKLFHNNTTPRMVSDGNCTGQNAMITSYTAVRFDPHTLSINTSDVTFAKVVSPTTQAKPHNFAEVQVCNWRGSLSATVDLRDTPLAIDADWVRKQWKGCGYRPTFSISCTTDNQICMFICSGASAVCELCPSCDFGNPRPGYCRYDGPERHRIQVVIADESEYRKV